MILIPCEMMLSHIATINDISEILMKQCQQNINDDLIKSTQLRLEGNNKARNGQLRQAEDIYTQAIQLDVKETLHLLYSNRSGVRLTIGNKDGALDDALFAIECSPDNFTTVILNLN